MLINNILVSKILGFHNFTLIQLSNRICKMSKLSHLTVTEFTSIYNFMFWIIKLVLQKISKDCANYRT